jgi:photosystem II stability/assembly factor-like uncharacterized protein
VLSRVFLSTVLLLVWASFMTPAQGAVIIDPAIPTTVFAAINDGALYKSTDGGVTWTEVAAQSGSIEVWRLFLDPQTSTTLYALDSHRNFLKSSDGGAHWTLLFHETTETPLLTVAIDPLMPTILYAGTNGAGVLKSSDGGKNWTTLMHDVPPRQKKVLTEPKGLLGYDRESPLSAVPSLLPRTIYVLALDPHTPTTLYAGTNNGVWKSTDSGQSWTILNSGFNRSTSDARTANAAVTHLTVAPTRPTTLYASMSFNGGGITTSTDGGASWNPPQRGWPANYEIEAIAIDPKTATTVYVALYMAGVFKSTDGGQHWKAINIGLPVYAEPRGGTSFYISDIAVDPQTPTTLYAEAFSNKGEGIFKSTNGGDAWTFSHLGASGFSP